MYLQKLQTGYDFYDPFKETAVPKQVFFGLSLFIS